MLTVQPCMLRRCLELASVKILFSTLQSLSIIFNACQRFSIAFSPADLVHILVWSRWRRRSHCIAWTICKTIVFKSQWLGKNIEWPLMWDIMRTKQMRYWPIKFVLDIEKPYTTPSMHIIHLFSFFIPFATHTATWAIRIGYVSAFTCVRIL